MRNLFLIVCLLMATITTQAQEFAEVKRSGGGFNVENSIETGETLNIDRQTFDLHETKSGSRFVKCKSPRTGNFYPVWVGIKTEFKNVKIIRSQDAFKLIREFYHDDIDLYESAFLLMVNARTTTIAYAKISQGGIGGTVIDPRIVAKYAIDSLCTGVIIAHNHPSSNTAPSEADRTITRKIKEALKLFDIHLLDHLVITDKDY